MNISKQFQLLINYIEDNLTESIDYIHMAKILGTNVDTLNRLFSILNNISLADYIRKRRLTKAGLDLLQGQKVIDVAFKYQYNSSSAFAVAFENMHQVKPSQVLQNPILLKNYPPLVFSHNAFSTIPEYHFLETTEFVLYGCKQKMKISEIRNLAPIFWDDSEKKYHQISSAPKNYGVINYAENWEALGIDYWAAVDVPFEGCLEITIPASKWIVFTINSLDFSLIPTISDNALFQYPQSEQYHIKYTLSLEVYYHKENYIEIWIPIQ